MLCLIAVTFSQDNLLTEYWKVALAFRVLQNSGSSISSRSRIATRTVCNPHLHSTPEIMLLHIWESWQILPYFNSCAHRRCQVWPFSNSSDGRVLQPCAGLTPPASWVCWGGGRFAMAPSAPKTPARPTSPSAAGATHQCTLEMHLLLMTIHFYSKVRDESCSTRVGKPAAKDT